MYFAKTAQKLREQMVRFSGELSAGLPKVGRGFVAEMIFGIQHRLIEQAAPRIEDDTLLVLDLSDMTKKYAEKMVNLGRVRDGSEKDLG